MRSLGTSVPCLLLISASLTDKHRTLGSLTGRAQGLLDEDAQAVEKGTGTFTKRLQSKTHVLGLFSYDVGYQSGHPDGR